MIGISVFHSQLDTDAVGAIEIQLLEPGLPTALIDAMATGHSGSAILPLRVRFRLVAVSNTAFCFVLQYDGHALTRANLNIMARATWYSTWLIGRFSWHHRRVLLRAARLGWLEVRWGCGTTSSTTAAGPWWGCRRADRCNRPPHPLHCSVCVVIPAVAMEAVQGPLPAFTSLWVRAASVVLATHFSACFLPFVPACPLPCLSALHPAGCLPTDWSSGRFADWK